MPPSIIVLCCTKLREQQQSWFRQVRGRSGDGISDEKNNRAAVRECSLAEASGGSRGFALILAGLSFHLVLLTLDLYSLALDVEAQAVEYRDVLVRHPDQGKEPEQ